MIKKPGASPRLLFIDGLRGVAALAVLLFHISTSDFFKHAPGWVVPLNTVANAVGFLGVEIFFVISGFVIAYSLRNVTVTGGFVVKFAVRRSLRLDPPYWSAIAMTVAISVLFSKALHATTYPVPSISTLAANLFYLQGILHRPQLLIVFWTLCYEIQYYLFYIFLQWIVQKMTRSSMSAHRTLTAILSLTGIASLVCFARDPSVGGWSYNWWYLFAFGAILSREMLVRGKLLGPIGVLLLLSVALQSHHLEPAAGALTGLALYAATQFNGLCTWLSNALIQYLGRISYSLYLTHTLALQILTGILLRIRLAPMFHSIPAYISMLLIPIICAEIFYRIIEKPSHQWAIHFGRPKTT